jgi:hypothetical protein
MEEDTTWFHSKFVFRLFVFFFFESSHYVVQAGLEFSNRASFLFVFFFFFLVLGIFY